MAVCVTLSFGYKKCSQLFHTLIPTARAINILFIINNQLVKPYSFLKLFTGLATAALNDCQLTVQIATNRAPCHRYLFVRWKD